MATEKTPGTPGKSIQEQLDEALADSFPASDPVSIVTSQTEEDWTDRPEGDDQATPAAGTPAKTTLFAGREKER